jgi:hypothetical protein
MMGGAQNSCATNGFPGQPGFDGNTDGQGGNGGRVVNFLNFCDAAPGGGGGGGGWEGGGGGAGPGLGTSTCYFSSKGGAGGGAGGTNGFDSNVFTLIAEADTSAVGDGRIVIAYPCIPPDFSVFDGLDTTYCADVTFTLTDTLFEYDTDNQELWLQFPNNSSISLTQNSANLSLEVGANGPYTLYTTGDSICPDSRTLGYVLALNFLGLEAPDTPSISFMATPPSLETALLPGATYGWYFNGVLQPVFTGNTYDLTTTGEGNYEVEVQDSKGCFSAISEVYTYLSASVANAQVFQQLSAYPNPSNGQFTLTWNTNTAANTTLRVLDALGRTLLEQPLQTTVGANQAQVQWPAGTAAGIYTLQLSTEGSTSSLRIVKQ